MLKKFLLVGVGITLAVGAWGCDELTQNLPSDAARMITSLGGAQGGDQLMDQTQQRDQLRDGSCGTCDGTPNPDAGGWQGSGDGGNGTPGGAGDQLRLRDGSCGL